MAGDFGDLPLSLFRHVILAEDDNRAWARGHLISLAGKAMFDFKRSLAEGCIWQAGFGRERAGGRDGEMRIGFDPEWKYECGCKGACEASFDDTTHAVVWSNFNFKFFLPHPR